MGGDLHPDTLRLAYRQGIFPWPHDGLPLLWFCPPRRAILDLSAIHIPKRLARTRRLTPLQFTIDTAFDRVISACRTSARPDQQGTWITEEVEEAYIAAHQLGFAHSAEAWTPDGELVGGVYGIDSGGAFGGESMFHRQADASKLALLHMVDHLAARGATFLDIQMMTPHMQRLGAVEIPRRQFLRRLALEQARNLTLF